MNKQAILHVSDSKFCYALDTKTVEVILRVSHEDSFEQVTLVYGNKYDYYQRQQKKTMSLRFSDGTFDYYQVRLVLTDVRFVYIFELDYGGEVFYFSEDGLSDTYDFASAYFNSFQLPYINKSDVMQVVPWLKNAVFYEIFIDRFYPAKVDKDLSYIDLDWGDIPTPKSFAGGDLQGIIKKLDYLVSLGINAIYLTPIFRSDSNHKYDIYDYYNVDDHFGTNNDFVRLVAEAHKRGIKVVLDAVFNHCSEKLAEFQDVLQKGKESKYFDWFIIDGDSVDYEVGNYEYFGVCKYMPKFNTSHPDTQKFLIDIATHWIKVYDIDGWRLDVSDEVSHDFWRKFRQAVKAVKADFAIIGENWHDANTYLQGDQYDSIMNYAFTKAMTDYFATRTLDGKELANRLSAIYMRNIYQANAMMMNLLDSHDTHRFFTRVEGNIDSLMCALAIAFCHTGSVCVYYGTEIPIEGGYDPDCRRTMDWSNEGLSAVGELIARLAQIKGNEILRDGDTHYGGDEQLFVLQRVLEGKSIVLTVNNSLQAVNKEFGKILFSHNYDKGKLESLGFVLEEV